MVVPIYDHSPFRWPSPPYVTWALIAVNVVVFLLQAGVGADQAAAIERFASVIPAVFVGDVANDAMLPGVVTLFTYTFLHANFLHLFGNMIFLWVFGDDIEAALGHGRFLAFYLGSGAGSALVFIVSEWHSVLELIGASGAVAGVIAAYLLYRPCAKVTVLVSVIVVRIAAYWVIGGWVAWQLIEVAMRTEDGVAYWAHVGGLLTGAILFMTMRPPGIALFDCMEPDDAAATGAGKPR
jgi:membrane associated rhomboid family serine protease